MRFQGVTIPQGATITAAYFTLVAVSPWTGTTPKSRITGENVDNAAAWSTLADYQARRGTVVGGANNDHLTAAQVNWDDIPAWSAGTAYNSPSIVSIIQEIVNRPGWASGNALALWWDDHDNRSSQIDACNRSGASWDSATYNPPALTVEYTVGGLGFVLSIAGTDRTAYFQINSLSIGDELNLRVAGSFRMLDPAGAYRPTEGQTVVITENGTKRFAGFIDTVTESKVQGSPALEYEVGCVDYCSYCDRHLVYAAYENMAVGNIVKDLISTWMAGEGVADTSVQTGPILAKAVFDGVYVTEALNQLCTQAGYSWYIDFDKVMHFFERSTNAAPFNITDSSAVFSVSIDKSRDQYRNRQHVRGADVLSDARTETFAGDGSRREFALSRPVGAAPTVKVNGASKTVGVGSVDTGKDWYWNGGSNTIRQDDSAAPLGAGDVLSVSYRHFFPAFAVYESPSEISGRQSIEGGSGVYESVADDSSIDDSALLRAFGEALLRKFGTMPAPVKYSTDLAGLRSGQIQTIQLTPHGLNGQYLLEKVVGRDVDGIWIRYEVFARSGEAIGGWVEFFKSLTKTGTRTVNAQGVVRRPQMLADGVTMGDGLTAASGARESRAGYAIVGYSEAG